MTRGQLLPKIAQNSDLLSEIKRFEILNPGPHNRIKPLYLGQEISIMSFSRQKSEDKS